MSLAMKIAAFLIMLTAVGVSGCGVRGSLEPPVQQTGAGSQVSAEGGNVEEESAAKAKPHRPFILDGLL